MAKKTIKKEDEKTVRSVKTETAPVLKLKTSYIIALLAISVVIVMVIAIVFLYLMSEPQNPIAERFSDNLSDNLTVPPPPGAIVVDPEQRHDNGNSEEEYTEGSGESGESETDEFGNVSQSSRYVNIGTYDIENFYGTLFIGDSIFTGIDGYDFLPSDNVFARVGINAEDIMNAEINGRTLFGDYGIAENFSRAVIMIGFNGLYDDNAVSVAEDVCGIARELMSRSSVAEVIILTAPPVCEDNDYDKDLNLILKFNEELLSKGKSFREDGLNIKVADYYSRLSDNDGYLLSEYAQPDGLHLTVKGYEVMFGLLQSEGFTE